MPNMVLTGKLSSALMYVLIIPLLKCKPKGSADVYNYIPITIAAALYKVFDQVISAAQVE